MIRQAKAHEKKEIHRLWQDAFSNDDNGSVDSYFDNYYRDQDSFVLVKDDEIVSTLQVRNKTLSLFDKNIRCSYIGGVLTREKYQRQGYMKQLLDHVLDEISTRDLITVLRAYDSSIYEPFGFQNVIDSCEYYINSSLVPDLGIDGIVLDPKSKDLLAVYDKFTKYFTGHFIRTEYDFDIMKKDIKAQRGSLIGYAQKGELLGYAIIEKQGSKIEILECCYDKSGTMLKLLSFVANSVSSVVLHTSSSERVNLLFPEAKMVKKPFLMARINDKQLIERLYNFRIISAYSAFHAFGRPLLNHDYQ